MPRKQYNYAFLGDDESPFEEELFSNDGNTPMPLNNHNLDVNPFIGDSPFVEGDPTYFDYPNSPSGFNMGAIGNVGKYGLAGLGIGGAIYGLYRLIDYFRNKNNNNNGNKPSQNITPPQVIQPPVSPSIQPNQAKTKNNPMNIKNKFKQNRTKKNNKF